MDWNLCGSGFWKSRFLDEDRSNSSLIAKLLASYVISEWKWSSTSKRIISTWLSFEASKKRTNKRRMKMKTQSFHYWFNCLTSFFFRWKQPSKQPLSHKAILVHFPMFPSCLFRLSLSLKILSSFKCNVTQARRSVSSFLNDQRSGSIRIAIWWVKHH